eukprot:scaffold95082_cov33-Tisochrysis_lutea.AAC.3
MTGYCARALPRRVGRGALVYSRGSPRSRRALRESRELLVRSPRNVAVWLTCPRMALMRSGRETDPAMLLLRGPEGGFGRVRAAVELGRAGATRYGAEASGGSAEGKKGFERARAGWAEGGGHKGASGQGARRTHQLHGLWELPESGLAECRAGAHLTECLFPLFALFT